MVRRTLKRSSSTNEAVALHLSPPAGRAPGGAPAAHPPRARGQPRDRRRRRLLLGARGFALQLVPQAPEVLITPEGNFRLIRRRQTLEQIVGNEVLGD